MADNSETRRERIIVETARHRIVGEVTLPAEGYRSRLSDLLNREGVSFIPLANAHITHLDDGEAPDHMSFVAVARDHVTIAYEDVD